MGNEAAFIPRRYAVAGKNAEDCPGRGHTAISAQKRDPLRADLFCDSGGLEAAYTPVKSEDDPAAGLKPQPLDVLDPGKDDVAAAADHAGKRIDDGAEQRLHLIETAAVALRMKYRYGDSAGSFFQGDPASFPLFCKSNLFKNTQTFKSKLSKKFAKKLAIFDKN